MLLLLLDFTMDLCGCLKNSIEAKLFHLNVFKEHPWGLYVTVSTTWSLKQHGNFFCLSVIFVFSLDAVRLRVLIFFIFLHCGCLLNCFCLIHPPDWLVWFLDVGINNPRMFVCESNTFFSHCLRILNCVMFLYRNQWCLQTQIWCFLPWNGIWIISRRTSAMETSQYTEPVPTSSCIMMRKRWPILRTSSLSQVGKRWSSASLLSSSRKSSNREAENGNPGEVYAFPILPSLPSLWFPVKWLFSDLICFRPPLV